MDLVLNHTPPDCALCRGPFVTYGNPRGPNKPLHQGSLFNSLSNDGSLVPANSALTFKKPHLLHCGHSACEPCLRSEFGLHTKITCKICEEVSIVPSNLANDELLQHFPLNYFLLGLWATNSSTTRLNSLDAGISFRPRDHRHRAGAKSGELKCGECLQSAAQYHCKQCGAPFCDKCFKAVHMVARSLRSHTKAPLIESYLELPALSCNKHSGAELKFFCLECKVPACPKCMIEEHQGHKIDLMENLTENYEEEFVDRYVKVANVLQILKTSHQTVEGVVDSKRRVVGERPTTQLHDSLYNTFIALHGKLSVLQNQLHLRLESFDELGQLESILRALQESMTATESLLNTSQILFKDSSFKKPSTFMAAIENLKRREDQPCYLFEENDVPCIPKLTINEDILRSLDEICTVELPAGEKYRLLREGELPAGYKKPPGVIGFTKEAVLALISESSEVSSILSDNFSDRLVMTGGRSLSPASSVGGASTSESTDTLRVADDLAVGCVVRVTITHLISPSDFYVQREGAIKKLTAFQNSLHSSGLPQRPPLKIETGLLYLVRYQKDSNWYRGRVLEVLPGDNYKVFYVDFGNSEVVPKTRFRHIPKSALSLPILVTRCKLNNCVPARPDGEWDPASITLMTKIIDNNSVTMVVIEKTASFAVVDLYKITDHTFVNVKDSLIFFEYASYAANTESNPPVSLVTNLPKELEIQPDKYTKGDIFEVHVSHVVSPFEFYVQNLMSSKRHIKLFEDINRLCSSGKVQSVYYPRVGMYVAAKFSKDKKWYRARILECLKKRSLKVFYIDFGGVEIVQWDQVQHLHYRCAKMSAQAIKCKLCDITPPNDESEWSPQICTYFKNLIFNQNVSVAVESIANKEDYQLSVVLYKSQTTVDVCINALLAKEGKALSTGPHSQETEHPKVVSKIHPIKKDVSAKAPTVEQQPKTVTLPSSEPPPPSSPALPPEVAVESQLISSIVKGPDGSLRIHVQIKRLQDPGEFYVTFSHYAESLATLHDKLQRHYASYKSDKTTSWEAGNICAVKYNSKWHRAMVVDRIQEGNFKLNLVDEGSEIETEVSNMCPLEESFLTHRDGVVKCHLGGLKPALSDSWSSTATIEMQDFFDNHKELLYISKMGDPTNSSMPVELFARIEKGGGPTDPIYYEWKSLNHYLRHIGYAKSDDIVQWDCEGNILNRHLFSQSETNLETLLAETLSKLSCSAGAAAAGGGQETSSTSKAASVSSGDLKEGEDLTGGESGRRLPQITIPDAWLPVKPLEDLKIVACPTYVDSNGTIYFHDYHKSSALLDEIRTALCMKYTGTLPKPCDTTLQAGDICITQYHTDQKWYRGVILKANYELDEYEVQFIDYGNVETCKLAELRKIPVCLHIPIQASKGRFINIEPVHSDGKWKEEEIEIFHFNLIDFHCQMELSRIPDKPDEYGIKKLIQNDGTNFISWLVKNDKAKYKKNSTNKSPSPSKSEVSQEEEEDDVTTIVLTSPAEETVVPPSSVENCPPKLPEMDWFTLVELDQGTGKKSTVGSSSVGSEERNFYLMGADLSTPGSSVVMEEDVDFVHWSFLQKYSQFDLKYKEFDIPPSVERLIVDPTAFHTPTMIICHLCDVEEDVDIIEKIDKFKTLSATLQEEGPLQPLLSQPYKYKCCIAEFSLDEQWYRAFILDSTSTTELLVQFVDFGNVETRPTSCVREIKEEWTELEIFGLLCELNINLSETADPASAQNIIADTLLSAKANGTLRAVIKARKPHLKVDIFKGSQLAYDHLIDENVISLPDDSL